jgi:hypothetical protein
MVVRDKSLYEEEANEIISKLKELRVSAEIIRPWTTIFS